MLEVQDRYFGNPSSVHAAGRAARSKLDELRERLAGFWNCKPTEIVFTSGGTEANNLAILGMARALRSKGRHLITTAIEHPSVSEPIRYLVEKEGFTVSLVRTDPDGFVDPDALREVVRQDTILASIHAANNVIGTLQNVARLGAVLREHGVVFHTDATQFFGKEPLHTIHDLGADLVSCCAHKVFGPKGIGALYVCSPLHLSPLILGGPQENGRRAGTENLVAISGLVTAFLAFSKPPIFERSRLQPLVEKMEAALRQLDGCRVWGGPPRARLCNTLAVTCAGYDNQSLLAWLDLEGVCVSGGSACSSGAIHPSPVLQGLGVPPTVARGLVRFSLGPETTEDEALRAVNLLAYAVSHQCCGG